MKCPVCSNDLHEKEVGGITVDVCEGGCGGVWFDNFEFERFDEKGEALGEELLDINRDKAVKVDFSKERFCPRCRDVRMVKHFVSSRYEVEIDECYVCGGIWLDAGELGDIRRQYNSDKERKDATRKYFSEAFDSKLEEMHRGSHLKRDKARKFASIFRFLCPSYYIPGDQSGGAF